jgi:hypothetical protein
LLEALQLVRVADRVDARDATVADDERECGTVAVAVTRVSASQVSLEREDVSQNSIVHGCRLLDVQEMSGIRDYLHPRGGREVTLGIPDEREIDAAIAIPVQV